MPLYEYKPTTEKHCEYCCNGFELQQRMADDPLKVCPRCGAPVKRAFSRFGVGKNILSPSNLKEHGFTRLRKVDKGVYVKD